MRLDEQASKTLLETYGIACPAGTVVTSADGAADAAKSLGPPSYVKALTTATSRAARGGVRIVNRVEDAADAFTAVTEAVSATRARIEKAVAADEWWYVAILLPTGADAFELLLSAQGGSGIESRSESLARVSVDPAIGLRDYHIRSATEQAGISGSHAELLPPLLSRCYQIMRERDLDLLELNPVAVTEKGLVVIDARISADDYALFRQSEIVKVGTQAQDRSIAAELRDLGVEYVPLGGRIGIVGLGAGLSMHLADWITALGGTPAFFFDATTAAVRDWPAIFAGGVPKDFAHALAHGIRSVTADTDVLLVNFTSGGTPVDGLCRGLLEATSQLERAIPLVVHVGGNRNEAARSLLRSAGIEAAPTLGDAVRQAVRMMPSAAMA
jgi:succinyl-CoA synthetase beta subunit